MGWVARSTNLPFVVGDHYQDGEVEINIIESFKKSSS